MSRGRKQGIAASEDQLVRICNVLLASVSKGARWSDGSPTAKALSLRDSSGGPLSSEERVMLLLAWAVWDGGGGLKVADLIASLDPRRLELVGSLLIAVSKGQAALDAWLEANEPKK